MDVCREFKTIEANGETFLIHLRRERPSSLLGPNSLPKMIRTFRGRLRWFVDVESGTSLLPILKEQFRSEADARLRAEEIRQGLIDGTIRIPRFPAVRWRRRSMSSPAPKG
ncbi:MAG TPA: hypothetical protein DEG43_03380 [Acidimicrobiaceae bacterium]|nr:hypothetical protein [Acidimicrobiaceae bacterium]